VSVEVIDQRIQKKLVELQRKQSQGNFRRSGRVPAEAIGQRLQQKLVEQGNRTTASAEAVEQ